MHLHAMLWGREDIRIGECGGQRYGKERQAKEGYRHHVGDSVVSESGR